MVGWFFLDALSLQGPRLHFTFWQILGYAGDGQTLYTAFDRNTPAGSSIFNALAWLALAGPFHRFVWKRPSGCVGGVASFAPDAGRGF